MATIIPRETKNGRTYSVVYRVDGKQVWVNGGKRKVDAERIKVKIEHEINLGIHKEMPDITFREFAAKWLDAKAPDVRPKTLRGYEEHLRLRIVPYFGDRKLKSITPEDVEGLKTAISMEKVSPATVVRYLVVAKMVFKTALIWGYTATNPAMYIKRPRTKKYEPQFLTPDEIKRLVEATPAKHKALMATACYTGMRQGEILGLKWDDIDFENKRVYVQRTLQEGDFYGPKSEASRRSVDIPGFLVGWLEEHQLRQAVEGSASDIDLVFPNEAGKPLDQANLIPRIFRPALVLAGLTTSLRFHDLRHSYASMLIHQGANIKYVQKQLGHATVHMTLNTYSHLLPDAGQEAIGRLEEAYNNQKEAIV